MVHAQPSEADKPACMQQVQLTCVLCHSTAMVRKISETFNLPCLSVECDSRQYQSMADEECTFHILSQPPPKHSYTMSRMSMLYPREC